jgi:phage-related minor tail protein
MSRFLDENLAEILFALMSIVAVLVSLFKAKSQETAAEAKAVNELAESSHDLRQWVYQLEEQGKLKDEELRVLREKAAEIPVLRAQVAYLTDEMNHLKKQLEEREVQIEMLIKAQKEV